MPGTPGFDVEVVHAQPSRALIRSYRVYPGTRVEDLLRLAAADPAFAGLDVAAAVVGIHGRVAHLEQELEMGDRLELYRPLAADPKQARRARARARNPSKSCRS